MKGKKNSIGIGNCKACILSILSGTKQINNRVVDFGIILILSDKLRYYFLGLPQHDKDY